MVNPDTLLITNEYVRQALDQLIQTTSSEAFNPLQFLQLVESRMLTADFSFFRQPRQFALHDLLTSVIQAEYTNQRALHDLPPVQAGITIAQAAVIIKEDAITANPNLIGWSWLYFHYVEVSLYISQQKFCEMVNLDDRTIRRYQINTIDQLTKQLIRMEQTARETRRHQLLYLQLPHQGNIPELIEREQTLQQLRDSQSKHFHIIGAPGIGKTVVTERFLQEMIVNDEVDQIVWFQSPENIESVQFTLKERLLVENSILSVAEYVSIKRVVVVIDNGERLQESHELVNFMQELSNAYIFLTSHIFYPLPNCVQVTLSELSFPSTKEILQTEIPSYKAYLDTGNVTQLVWQTTGGNPLAVKLLAQNWLIFDVQSAALLTLEQLFSNLYDSILLSERLAWLILALLNNFSSSLTELSQIHSQYVTADDFIKLNRLCIASTIHDEASTITLSLSAQRYIQYQYAIHVDLQKEFASFMESISWNNESGPEITLALNEAVLSADWVVLNSDYLLEAVHQFCNKGLLSGHYAQWYSILGIYTREITRDNLDLVLGYGICLRYLGQWSQARSVFNSLINYTGRYGYFLLQAQALLELAILCRYQGDYESVDRAMTHIGVLPTLHFDVPFQTRLIIERTEIVLEKNNLSAAKDLLNLLPNSEPRKTALQIEIYTREPSTSLDKISLLALCDKLFSDAAYSSSITARVHILIGRIWERLSDIELAIKHLSIALSLLLKADNDPFALARTQVNLASAFIEVNRLTDARDLLDAAGYIQRQIGDRVGLAVTIHNKRVLDRRIVS